MAKAIKNYRSGENSEMENNPIKTADLCERCVYSTDRTCDNYFDCQDGCPCFTADGRCRCLGISGNTPCPYFEDAET